MEIRIGISGWAYKEWRGSFYPRGLTQKRELEYASRQVNSIEINGTFYSLQSAESFGKWATATPDDFIFAVKGSKFITHQKKLKDVRIALANFFASGVLRLGRKLGPILWQFAPWYRFDAEVVEDFLTLLPKTASDAADLARENTNMREAWIEVTDDVSLRYAFEPRHPSFFNEGFVRLLRRHNSALVVADTAEKIAMWEDVTADFVYVRLHGKDAIYESDYTSKELNEWAARIRRWSQGSQPSDAKLIIDRSPTKRRRDVFVYFDNSINGHAPHDAVELARILHDRPDE